MYFLVYPGNHIQIILARDQAPHWGRKEKKICMGENEVNRKVVWEGVCHFPPLWSLVPG